MSDENNIPRRKALVTTASLGSAMIGLPSAAAASKGSGKGSGRGKSGKGPRRGNPGKNSDYILDEDYWTNENGRVEFDHANFDEWDVVVTDATYDTGSQTELQTAQTAVEPDIYVGKQKNATLESGSPVRNVDGMTTSSLGSMVDTYITLASGTIPNYVPGIGGSDWELNAGVKFNMSALSVDINIAFKVGVTEVVLWGWSLGYKDSKGLCTEVTPSQFPVSIEPCIDVTLDGDTMDIGGSISLCTPPDDPCPVVSCQYCLTGLGFSKSIDLPW